MSHQRKLEQAFEYLLAEDTERATKLIHQVIVEKARGIYESIIDEELDEAEAGGEPNKDFTDEISTDSEEIDSEELKGGEAGEEEDDDFELSAADKKSGEDEDEDEDEGEEEKEPGEGDLESEVEALRAELESLRADFDQLMGEEMQEPQHADLANKMGGGMGSGMGGMAMEDDMEEMAHAPMFEKKRNPKLEVADQPHKNPAKGKKEVEEETQFLTKVADTGQKGTAKLVGAGTHSKLGAEQTKSTFTNAPKKNDYGGKPVDFTKGTGGEYGKYHGDSAKDDTPSDNVNEQPKKSNIKADATPKYTGGKAAGAGFDKSPFTSKPR